MQKFALTLASMAAAATFAAPVHAQDLVGLITKTEVPFFIAMRRGAEAAAEELGLELQSFSGRDHGDNETQVAAIETLIAAGAVGFALVPADPAAIGPTVQKARDAGLLVITLDTPLDPIDSADATFATDNRLAGQLIGQWAAAKLGEERVATSVVALLDYSNAQVSVDYLRDQGFMEGFGFDVGDPNRWGDEDDARICGHFMTGANEEGGRTAMEQALQKCPEINVVYTINEPTAAGASEALRAMGRDDGSILVLSIDGGCDGVNMLNDGTANATSMQFPDRMASLAMEALAHYAATGEKPDATPGLDFTNTGTELFTNDPQDGIPSEDATAGLAKCWG